MLLKHQFTPTFLKNFRGEPPPPLFLWGGSPPLVVQSQPSPFANVLSTLLMQMPNVSWWQVANRIRTVGCAPHLPPLRKHYFMWRISKTLDIGYSRLPFRIWRYSYVSNSGSFSSLIFQL